MTVPTYNAAQAAKLCAVSKRTVYRLAADLETHGAWRDASGQWNIPVEALVQVGLKPGRPARPAPLTPVTPGQSAVQPPGDNSEGQGDSGVKGGPGDTSDTELDQLRSQITALRRRAELAELAQNELQTAAAQIPELLRRAEVAEAIAAERQHHNDSLTLALRQLQPTPQRRRFPFLRL